MSIFRHFRFGPLDRQLDTKGRISLPVDWRPPAEESFYLVKVKVFGVPGLRALTQGAFSKKLEDIEELPGSTPRLRDQAKNMLFGATVEGNVSAQGKLTIPKALAESHGMTLPGTVTLIGRGDSFEIFTPENATTLEAAEAKEREENSMINDVLNLS